MSRFEVGKTYFGRSVCDSSCIITITVKSRTEKRIVAATQREPNGKIFGIKTASDGAEYVMPWGRYSMAPCVRADRPYSENVERRI